MIQQVSNKTFSKRICIFDIYVLHCHFSNPILFPICDFFAPDYFTLQLYNGMLGGRGYWDHVKQIEKCVCECVKDEDTSV